ncbi:MAG TPA: ABC transporter substrate-binding protein [Thermodesulfobacteriota bacterium]|nr:ABC transporter substrate-binding protein [Thermodesulfobacteriota bacterium]
MRKFTFASLILLAVILLASFPVTGRAAETIKLGVTEPLSGTFKNIGERYLEGVQYAAKVLNQQGGVLGRQIEVIPIDSELKPDVVTRKSTALILKDQVKYFCGGTGSSVGAAMSTVAEQNNAVMFSYGMDAASLTGQKCSKNFFRPGTNTDMHSYALAAYIAKSKFKKVYCIGQDYSFGYESIKPFISRIKKLNPSIEIVAEVYHPLGEKDFGPYVSRIVASGADLVFTTSWGNDLTLLVKQAKPFGLKAKFAGYYLSDEETVSAIGESELLVGSIASETYMLTIPTEENKRFIEGYYKDKGSYPFWLRGKSYNGTMFWAEALKRAGKDDVSAVIKAWEGLSYNGTGGTMVMRACDHQAQVPIWIAEIVPQSKFMKLPYVGEPIMISAKDIEVSCEDTGCKMK